MARVSLDPPRTLTNRFVAWFSRRKFGRQLEPARAAGHNRRVLMAFVRNSMRVDRWNAVDKPLKNLAEMRAALTIGCEWCADFGYWISVNEGMDPDKVRAVPAWRESPLFTPLERLVLEYAESMTVTPPAVTDALVAALREHLDDAQLVELTAIIALENQYGRNNLALGLAPQGFKDECEIR